MNTYIYKTNRIIDTEFGHVYFFRTVPEKFAEENDNMRDIIGRDWFTFEEVYFECPVIDGQVYVPEIYGDSEYPFAR